jgi:hypothetical protein
MDVGPEAQAGTLLHCGVSLHVNGTRMELCYCEATSNLPLNPARYSRKGTPVAFICQLPKPTPRASFIPVPEVGVVNHPIMHSVKVQLD